MDSTERKITKIAREANRFTVQTMKEDGIGTAEMDVIHFVRHNPGTTQKEMWEALKIDKGATARRVARLEEKGYLTREPNPLDGRSQLLYPTEKAEALRLVAIEHAVNIIPPEIVFVIYEIKKDSLIFHLKNSYILFSPVQIHIKMCDVFHLLFPCLFHTHVLR